MKNCWVVFFLLFVIRAQADDIAVYKFNIVTTATGDGAITKTRRMGWAVFDRTFGALTLVKLNPTTRRFTFEEVSNVQSTLPVGSEKSYSLIYFQSGEFFHLVLQGMNRKLDLYKDSPKPVAFALRATGTELLPAYKFGEVVVYEYSGYLVLDRPVSSFAVRQDHDFQQTLDHLSSILTAKGYVGAPEARALEISRALPPSARASRPVD